MNNQIAKIGVVTVSDRASAGVYEDLGGPAIKEFLTTHLTNEWVAVSRVVPDEVAAVSGALIELADTENCCLIVTTGGTGTASPRMPARRTMSIDVPSTTADACRVAARRTMSIDRVPPPPPRAPGGTGWRPRAQPWS